ncbi:unnamed protein product, partial [Discosporangium mesarthrocarpum]
APGGALGGRILSSARPGSFVLDVLGSDDDGDGSVEQEEGVGEEEENDEDEEGEEGKNEGSRLSALRTNKHNNRFSGVNPSLLGASGAGNDDNAQPWGSYRSLPRGSFGGTVVRGSDSAGESFDTTPEKYEGGGVGRLGKSGNVDGKVIKGRTAAGAGGGHRVDGDPPRTGIGSLSGGVRESGASSAQAGGGAPGRMASLGSVESTGWENLGGGYS